MGPTRHSTLVLLLLLIASAAAWIWLSAGPGGSSGSGNAERPLLVGDPLPMAPTPTELGGTDLGQRRGLFVEGKVEREPLPVPMAESESLGELWSMVGPSLGLGERIGTGTTGSVTLTGTVLLPSRLPLPEGSELKAWFSYSRPGESYTKQAATIVGELGRFSMTVKTGIVPGRGMACVELQVRHSEREGAAAVVLFCRARLPDECEGGVFALGTVILEPPPLLLSGQVVDLLGTALSGYAVRVYALDPKDRDGRCSILRVAPPADPREARAATARIVRIPEVRTDASGWFELRGELANPLLLLEVGGAGEQGQCFYAPTGAQGLWLVFEAGVRVQGVLRLGSTSPDCQLLSVVLADLVEPEASIRERARGGVLDSAILRAAGFLEPLPSGPARARISFAVDPLTGTEPSLYVSFLDGTTRTLLVGSDEARELFGSSNGRTLRILGEFPANTEAEESDEEGYGQFPVAVQREFESSWVEVSRPELAIRDLSFRFDGVPLGRYQLWLFGYRAEAGVDSEGPQVRRIEKRLELEIGPGAGSLDWLTNLVLE